MSKYARKVDGGFVDPVSVPNPVPFGDTAEGFLAIMFPGSKGWEEVDDAFGQVPPASDPPEAPQISKADLLTKVQELIDAVSALPDEVMHVQV